jgi:glycolate oxidase iron-sulfur subunit
VSSSTPATPARFDDRSLVDYTKTLDCIHCGLCLQTCPTYQLTGVESSSPRGRIALMRGVAEGKVEPDAAYAEELDFCLLCRHCETACPAGVKFGALMEHARSSAPAQAPRGVLARLARFVGFRVLLPSRVALDVFAWVARLAQVLGLERLALALWKRVHGDAPTTPRIPPARARRALPKSSAPIGAARGTAFVLEGCVMPILFGRVNRATVRSLQHLGCEVRPLPGGTCCGSLHAHNGDLEGARALARSLLRAAQPGDTTPIVVNSAGCSAHLKELAHLFAPDAPEHAAAAAFGKRVVDFNEFVAARIEERPPDRSIEGAWRGAFTYDDPCHLCHGQGVRAQPRKVLGELPGLRLVPLANSESCCGSAGIYSLLRPADSAAVLEPKLDALVKSGARTLVTANPGCHLQWEAGIARRGLDVRVVHVAEVVARAYDGSTTQ